MLDRTLASYLDTLVYIYIYLCATGAAVFINNKSVGGWVDLDKSRRLGILVGGMALSGFVVLLEILVES